MAESHDKIVLACEEAKDKLSALGIEEQLVSELEWCLGSYAHDGNADGLYIKGKEALAALEKYKKDHPRKVSKKMIDTLDKLTR